MVLLRLRPISTGWRRLSLLGVLALAATLHAGPAGAQTFEVSGACAQQCGTASRLVRENRGEVQACLIRCNAKQDFDRAAAVPPPHYAPPPARSREGDARRAGTARPKAAEPAARHHATGVGAPANRAGSPVVGAPPRPATASVAAPPRSAPHHAASSTAMADTLRGLPMPTATRPIAEAAARPTQLAAAAALGTALATTPAAGRWGVAYLAAAPATEFGLVVGVGDRLAAHAEAQAACGARGNPCRPALEFTEQCGAVAQARRTLGLFRTSDPRTYSVSYAAAGSGTTRDTAETRALAECQARERTTSCEIVASQCGRP